MGLDIRLPIGGLFSILGLLLAGYGLVSDRGIYVRSLGINVNLWWGVALLVFGLVMIVLGRSRSTTGAGR
jgi:hypothetical protein